MKKRKGVYFHKPFPEKATFTTLQVFVLLSCMLHGQNRKSSTLTHISESEHKGSLHKKRG